MAIFSPKSILPITIATPCSIVATRFVDGDEMPQRSLDFSDSESPHRKRADELSDTKRLQEQQEIYHCAEAILKLIQYHLSFAAILTNGNIGDPALVNSLLKDIPYQVSPIFVVCAVIVL
jgi:hypothetical protein